MSTDAQGRGKGSSFDDPLGGNHDPALFRWHVNDYFCVLVLAVSRKSEPSSHMAYVLFSHGGFPPTKTGHFTAAIAGNYQPVGFLKVFAAKFNLWFQ